MDDTSRDAPAPEAANLDRETLQRLASLGYVGGGSPASKSATASGTLADPKDRLAAFVEVQRAGELMGRDEYGPAVEALEAALKEDPSMPQARVMLGSCYSEMGRTSDARNQFDSVLKDDPQSIAALIGLANVMLPRDRRPTSSRSATARCRSTIATRRPTRCSATSTSAGTSRRRALPYLEKAVPDSTEADAEPGEPGRVPDRGEEFLASAADARGRALPVIRDFPARSSISASCTRSRASRRRRVPRTKRKSPTTLRASRPGSTWVRRSPSSKTGRGRSPRCARLCGLRRDAPKGYLFLARGLLHETAAPLDETERLVQQGLSWPTTADLKALGWFLMADIFNRRHQPEQMNAALKNARRQAAAVKGAPRETTTQRN
jgi:tetratricopeptide (TPR) repeat protein